MKPIAIFRWTATEGPGYFATFLDSHSIPWQLIKIDEGESIPAKSENFSGIALMGGPMSVNDTLAWIPQAEELIRNAVKNGVPLIGHCLGGQLISKALGGMVSAAPIPEIGWTPVNVINTAIAHDWFGDSISFETFQWHYETFSIPPGATRILESPFCGNQAYALGKHLGLQCHIEMTAELIETWCTVGKDELENPSTARQSAAVIRQQTAEKLPKLSSVADRVYAHWIKGLV